MSPTGRVFVAAGIVAVGLLSSWLLRAHPEETRLRQPGDSPIKPGAIADSRTKPPSRTPDTVKMATDNNGDGEIVLLGAVQSESQNTISCRMPSRIARVLVKEGDVVARGQLILQLDGTELKGQESVEAAALLAAESALRKAQAGVTAQTVKADADVNAARNGVRQADARVRQATLARDAARDDGRLERDAANENVRKAAVAADLANRSLASLEALADVGGVSRNDVDSARAQRDTAASDLAAARLQLQRLDAGPIAGSGASYRVELAEKDVESAQIGARDAAEGFTAAVRARAAAINVGGKDIDAARAAVRQARSAYDATRANEGQSEIRSSVDGVASDVNIHSGDTAQPGIPLLTVVSLSQIRVDALASARVLPQLSLGEPADVQVDTYPGRSFSAAVAEISRIAEPDGRSFRVQFHLSNPTGLRPGQSARIRIAHKRKHSD